MDFWQELFGGSSKFNEDVKRISHTLIAKAAVQSHEMRVNPDREADKLAAKCGVSSNSPMLRKPHHPANFVDVVFGLLCYPPELACVIALRFAKFEHYLGFQPFGTIMVAMTQIHSLYSGGMLVRASELADNPELDELLSDKPLRAQKSGEMLARAFFMHSQSLKEVRALYRNNRFDPAVKQALNAELRNIAGKELANAIIGS